MPYDDDSSRDVAEYTLMQQASILLLCLLVGVPLLWLTACAVLSGEVRS